MRDQQLATVLERWPLPWGRSGPAAVHAIELDRGVGMALALAETR